MHKLKRLSHTTAINKILQLILSTNSRQFSARKDSHSSRKAKTADEKSYSLVTLRIAERYNNYRTSAFTSFSTYTTRCVHAETTRPQHWQTRMLRVKGQRCFDEKICIHVTVIPHSLDDIGLACHAKPIFGWYWCRWSVYMYGCAREVGKEVGGEGEGAMGWVGLRGLRRKDSRGRGAGVGKC